MDGGNGRHVELATFAKRRTKNAAPTVPSRSAKLLSCSESRRPHCPRDEGRSWQERVGMGTREGRTHTLEGIGQGVKMSMP